MILPPSSELPYSHVNFLKGNFPTGKPIFRGDGFSGNSLWAPIFPTWELLRQLIGYSLSFNGVGVDREGLTSLVAAKGLGGLMSDVMWFANPPYPSFVIAMLGAGQTIHTLSPLNVSEFTIDPNPTPGHNGVWYLGEVNVLSLDLTIDMTGDQPTGLHSTYPYQYGAYGGVLEGASYVYKYLNTAEYSGDKTLSGDDVTSLDALSFSFYKVYDTSIGEVAHWHPAMADLEYATFYVGNYPGTVGCFKSLDDLLDWVFPAPSPYIPLSFGTKTPQDAQAQGDINTSLIYGWSAPAWKTDTRLQNYLFNVPLIARK